MTRFAYLLKLETDSNHNRYYRMIAQPDGTFQIEMGRVGAQPVKLKRPLELWDDTLSRKLKEGYIDRSEACQVTVRDIRKYAPIQEPAVKELFDSLMRYADIAIKDSYTVTWSEVSQEMIDHAQDILSGISGKSVDLINKELEKLFIAIPRRMKDVRASLIKSPEEIPEVLQREQDLLDVLRAKAKYSEPFIQTDTKPTFLEANGLEARPCTDQEIDQILRHLTKESAPHFVRAYRIRNQKTDAQFYQYLKQHNLNESDIHYYYHGSPNMNYIGLITQGQKLNPKAPIAGKMFGQGLYYAPRAKKSIGYTSICDRWRNKGLSKQGYLAVFKVAYKRPLHAYSYDPKYQFMDMNEIRPNDALYAHADGGLSLYNDEIIVYNEAQVTMQYLIEIKK